MHTVQRCLFFFFSTLLRMDTINKGRVVGWMAIPMGRNRWVLGLGRRDVDNIIRV